jgi:hypothetical protein
MKEEDMIPSVNTVDQTIKERKPVVEAKKGDGER